MTQLLARPLLFLLAMDAAEPDSPPDAVVEQIARDVEGYLARHPGAADTAEGIARWWLVQSQVEAQLPRIESALDLLVSRGVLKRRRLPDGNCVYVRANKSLR